MPPPRTRKSEDVALSLTLAVVASSPAPLLLLDGQLKVIAASQSFCEAFDGSPEDLVGNGFYDIASGAWDLPDLRTLMQATIAGELSAGGPEIELKRRRRPTRRLIVQARRLTYLDLDRKSVV